MSVSATRREQRLPLGTALYLGRLVLLIFFGGGVGLFLLRSAVSRLFLSALSLGFRRRLFLSALFRLCLSHCVLDEAIVSSRVDLKKSIWMCAIDAAGSCGSSPGLTVRLG
eukprot:scaffold46214_cov60-Attheya_sp.AAC.4